MQGRSSTEKVECSDAQERMREGRERKVSCSKETEHEAGGGRGEGQATTREARCARDTDRNRVERKLTR